MADWKGGLSGAASGAAASLSPRVRRHRRVFFTTSSTARSISACAEAPSGCSWRASTWGVYLRVCGGTIPKGTAPVSGAGLSPRVRRHHRRDRLSSPRGGSISACAEARSSIVASTSNRRVYLRVCGGTVQRVRKHRWNGGLSPRVRRHPAGRTETNVHGGSISACAEAPAMCSSSVGAKRVYLRVCGGTLRARSPHAVRSGLSPRVRRHPRSFLRELLQRRSISACAEAPRHDSLESSPDRVYLRVCGGTFPPPR